MTPTPKPAPFLTIAEWANRLNELHDQAIESGLSEDELRDAIFNSIPSDAPNRIEVIQPLLTAIDESDVFSAQTKSEIRNLTWENNHILISQAMSKFMTQNRRMPNMTTIAYDTGLSRQTVAKHIQTLRKTPGYQAEQQKFFFARSEVIAKLYSMAMKGNMHAIRYYLEATNPDTMAGTAPTNFIQVNNMKIDQITFMNLPEPVRQQIGELIQTGIQDMPDQKVNQA